MNDRFKFRVWDDVSNKYVNKGILLRCGDLAIPTMKNNYDLNPVDGRYLKEQCTGLKDKNGTLIYEGDIIRCQYITKYRDGVVVWNNKESCFSILVDEKLYSFIPRKDEDTIIIIGNINENPKLLEEKAE